MADEDDTPTTQFPSFFKNLPPGMREMYENAWAGGDKSVAPLLQNLTTTVIPGGGPPRGAFETPPIDDEVTDG